MDTYKFKGSIRSSTISINFDGTAKAEKREDVADIARELSAKQFGVEESDVYISKITKKRKVKGK